MEAIPSVCPGSCGGVDPQTKQGPKTLQKEKNVYADGVQ